MSWQTISPSSRATTRPCSSEPRPNEPQDTVRGTYWGPITRDNTGTSTRRGGAGCCGRAPTMWISLSRFRVHWTRRPPDLPKFALVSIIDPSP
jgi:hypothetical protein